MASIESVLKLVLLGEDRTGAATAKAASGLKDVADKGAAAAGPLNGLKGAIAGISGALVAVGVKKFADDSVSAFTGVAESAISMSRATGMSTQDASRLNFALQMSGVSGESASKGIKTFDKALGSASASDGKAAAAADAHREKLEGQIAALEKAKNPTEAQRAKLAQLKDQLAQLPPSQEAATSTLKKLGIEYQDSHGKLLPMSQLLPQVAEKFKTMKDGPEKSALAMKLFGKSGMDMIPFLNKGKDGIAELTKKSDEFGMTVDDKMTKAMKDAKANTREWDAANQGLKVQIGAQLLPVMTSASKFITANVVPAVVAVTGFVKDHNAEIQAALPVIGGLVTVAGTVVAGVKAWSIAQGILNAVLSANPISIVVIAIVALIAILVSAYNTNEDFRRAVDGAWKAVTTAIGDGARTVGQWLTQVGTWFTNLARDTGKNIDDIGRWWTSLPGKITDALVHLPDQLKQLGIDMVNGIIRGADSMAGDLVKKITSVVSGPVDAVKSLLGINSPSRLFDEEIGQMVVEGAAVGAEKKADRYRRAVVGALGYKPSPAELAAPVYNTGRRAGLYSAAAAAVVINVAGSVIREKDLAVTVRDHIAQGIRRRGGDPAILGV